MRRITKFFALLLGVISYTHTTTIKILYTAALIDKHFEGRKQEYLHSLGNIYMLGFEPYIVEACKKAGPTFFDEHCKHVFYAKSNNPRLKNKGVNEASTMLESLNYFDFDDEDMILKITGRYYLKSDFLIQMIKNNPEHDAFVKLDPHGQVFTGCFAMRYKDFKQMLEQLDFAYMEKYMINIEREVADYLRYRNIKTLKLHKVDVAAKIFGTGASYSIKPTSH